MSFKLESCPRFSDTAEVNVLHDILGDSGGRDEFQEELENTISEQAAPTGLILIKYNLL